MTENTHADVALRVLVYSHDAATRGRVMTALGTRPHPDLPRLDHLEVATAPVVIEHMDAGGIDLAILDGGVLDHDDILNDVEAVVLYDFLNEFLIEVNGNGVAVCTVVGGLPVCK